MSGGDAMIRRTIPIVVLALLSGCSWPGVAWKPDSSGFYYTDKAGSRLVSFDLKTKASIVLVNDTETRTLQPALSPDGKRIAVARREHHQGFRPRVQIRIYSTDGKEEKRSGWFERPADPANQTSVEPAYLFWGAPERILVIADGTAIYDVARDRLIEVDKGVQAPLGVYGTHPDGKGFLAYKDTTRGAELYFLDWDAKAQRLAGALPMDNKDGATFLTAWDGDVALLMHGGTMYEADIAKKILRPSKRKVPPLLLGEGTLLAYHVFPGGAKALCLLHFEERTAKEERKWQRIEVQDLAALTRTTLVNECETLPLLYPSPDRKRVALFYGTGRGGDSETRLLVVGADGKAAADLKLEQ